MCYSTNARPPLPPVAGGAGSAEGRDIVLTSADGTRFAGYCATAQQPGGSGIVILPDIRGLHPFYQDLALRFAEAGVHATAFDYFGRTAGVGTRDDEFEHMPHVEQTRPDTIAADVSAAVAHVRSPEGGAAENLFTVGFCFGGRNSWLSAAGGHGLAGAIGFYGVPGAGRDGSPGPRQRAAELEAPILALMGGADQAISAADIAS